MTYAAYDDDAIWGLGDSPTTAIADARQWYPVSDGKPPRLSIAEITLRLEVIVRQHYHGRKDFVVRPDGVLDIPTD